MIPVLKSILFVAAVALLTMGMFPVAAQVAPIPDDDCGRLGIACNENAEAGDVADLILTVINSLLVILSIIAVAIIIYAGVKYVISLGNEEEIAKAKRIIVYTVVGLIVIGLAAVVVNFVIGLAGGGNAGGGGNQAEGLPGPPGP